MTSTAPIVYFNDVSVSMVTYATAVPLIIPNDMPNFYIVLEVDKTLLFSNGFQYTVEVDGSGTPINIYADMVDNVNLTHLKARFEGQNSIWNQNGATRVSYVFENMPRTVPFSCTNSRNKLGITSVGTNVLMMAAASIILKNPDSPNQVFSDAGSASDSLNIAIASAIKSYLSDQEKQDAIFQKILQVDGPIITYEEGTHILPYTNEMTNLTIAMQLNNIVVNVDFNGEMKPVTLNEVPLFLDLVDMSPN